MTRDQLIKHWDVIQAFKEGKEIQFRKIGEKLWQDSTGVANFDFYLNYEYREKPTSTKRLPTIEEVEKWFMENRVFIYKKTNVLQRIICIDRNNKDNEPLNTWNNGWQTIESFCADYTNIDGSELYITE